MRQILILFASLCLTGFCGAHETQPEDLPGFVDLDVFTFFEEIDPAVDMSINAPLLRQLAKAVKWEDRQMAEALRGLELIRVTRFPVRDMPKKDVVDRLIDVEQALDRAGWETLAHAHKKKERLTLYGKMDGDCVLGLLAVVFHPGDPHEVVFANLVGEIDPEQIGRIGRKFEIDAFKRAGKLLPGPRAKKASASLVKRHFRTRRANHIPIPNVWGRDYPDGFLMRYNRVDGLFAGWRLPLKYRRRFGLAHYGELGYGFHSEQVRYQAGTELFSFYDASRSNMVALGAELHDVTDTQDGWLLSEFENSAYAVLFKRDFLDYYRRLGGSAYITHDIGDALQVTGRAAFDEYDSLENRVHWSVFGDRWGRVSFRQNPAIDEGRINSMQVDLQADTRNRRKRPRRGWFARGMFERAGGFMEGDYAFERYLADLRRYQPVGLGTRLDLRVRLGTARGSLPRQFRYDLGGFSSLRGYGFKAFTGDRMVLFNAVYWIDGSDHFNSDWPLDGLDVGVFFDAGSAWFAEDAQDPFDGVTDYEDRVLGRMDLKRSFGMALNIEGFHIYMAKPLDKDNAGWDVSMRFSRSF